MDEQQTTVCWNDLGVGVVYHDLAFYLDTCGEWGVPCSLIKSKSKTPTYHSSITIIQFIWNHRIFKVLHDPFLQVYLAKTFLEDGNEPFM